jgi:hypothetical protein
MSQNRNGKILAGIFLIGFLLCVMGSCSARVAYQEFGEPEWLDSLVNLLGGSACSFAGLMVWTVAFTYYWKNNKAKAFIAFVVGISVLLLGLMYIWYGLVFFLAGINLPSIRLEKIVQGIFCNLVW